MLGSDASAGAILAVLPSIEFGMSARAVKRAADPLIGQCFPSTVKGAAKVHVKRMIFNPYLKHVSQVRAVAESSTAPLVHWLRG